MDFRRFSVLRYYKHLLTLAKRLPTEKERTNAVTKIRDTFRQNKNAASEEEIQKLLESAQKRISYLRMITPKRADENDADISNKVYVVNNGKIEFAGEGQGDINGFYASRAAMKSQGLSTSDLKRHQENLNRFHFGNHVVKPTGPKF